MKHVFLLLSLVLTFNFFSLKETNAQCPELLNGSLVFTDAPYWVSCGGANYFLTLQTNMIVGNYTVDWGDGSPLQVGSGFGPADLSVNHLYLTAVDTFILVFTPDPGLFPGCQITGVVVMEEKTTSEIGIPFGVDLSVCVPGDFSFINNSNQTSGKPVSETTVFTWDFGDGSPPVVYDNTNAGQMVTHTYLPNNSGCGITVSLTAANYCGVTTSTFGTINTWDVDTAHITPSDLVLCYPDTIFTFFNTTDMNCQPDNSAQRYEYWNFGDYWGLGYDSIINWTPWPPTAPRQLGFPGPGAYTVMLIDSSYCGLDTAYQTVFITVTPEVDLTVFPDTVCEYEVATFIGSVIANTPNSFSWNFDDGTGWLGLGAGIQNYSYTNSGDYTVQFVGSVSAAGSGCTDTASVNIHVQPTPTSDFLLSTNNECDSMTVTFTDNSSGGAISWNWDFGNGNTSNLQVPPTQFYSSPGFYNVTLIVASSNGCTNISNQVVNVWQSPVANFLVSTVCEDAVTDFLDLSSFPIVDPIISWSWDFGDGNTSILQNPSHLYANAGVFNVTLTVQTSNCSSTIITPITVEPKPLVSFVASPDSGCTTLNVAFTNNTIGANNYVWEFGDGFISGLQDPTHAYVNIGVNDTTYLIQLIATSPVGCKDTANSSVTVYPGSLAEFTNTPVPNCAPASVQFTNNSINGISYEWNFDDGSPISTLVNPAHVFVNTSLFIQNYNVQLVAFSANGCSDTVIHTLSVNPQLVLSIVSNPDSGCSPLLVNFPQSANDGAVAWYWEFGDGNTSNQQSPTHTYYNFTTNSLPFTAVLIASNAFGCADTATTDVIVHPNPTSAMSAIPALGCAPLLVEFENLSTGGLTHIWKWGDGTSNDTTNNSLINHVYNNFLPTSQQYLAQLIAITDKGCTDTVAQTIEVFPEVVAQFTAPDDGCAPLNAVFLNQSIGADQYEWEFGDGSNTVVSQNAQHIYSNNSWVDDTTFTSVLYAISPFGCRDTAYHDITIHPKPLSQFVMGNTTGCSPLPVDFENQSIGGTFYQWNYGDNTPINNTGDSIHTHLFYNVGGIPLTFQTQLFVETNFGCRDTSLQNIQVFPQVTAAFTSPDSACSPAQIQFVNNSTGANNYLWNFGDGLQSISINPIHNYVNNSLNDSIFSVQLIASSANCIDTAFKDITILAQPIAFFEIDTIINCYPVEALIHNTTEGATLYFWDYGDGQTSTNDQEFHSVVYTNNTPVPINRTINMIATSPSGCVAQYSQILSVLPEMVIDVNFDTIACNPLTINVENNTIGALYYFWEYGDGFFDNIAEPTHTYNNFVQGDSIYSLVYIARGYEGCADTLYQDMYVLQVPEAIFTANPVNQTYPSATVDLFDLSNSGDVNYTWTFGDGEISNDPLISEHTYNTWGIYTITLTLNNGSCSSNAEQIIQIAAPVPIANFIGSDEGCTPMVVHFTNLSLYASSYIWDFGDGGQSNLENPTYTYYNAGEFIVSLTAIGEGGQDIEQHVDSITVYPQAFAYFTPSTTTVYIPNDPVTFFNLSQNATNYQWDFGDGLTSIEENPIHFYTTTGWQTVTLIANNEYNCPSTFYSENIVFAEASGNVDFPNAFTPDPNGSSGGYYDPQNPGENLNDVFHPVFSAGIEEYQLLIFNRWGELIFESTDIYVGWDGYYKGRLSQQDVYVWKVKARTVQGTVINDAGDVTLIR